MVPSPPSSPFDRIGQWGKPTSTLDWCEENYVVSPSIAEYWNTISNLMMILPPLFTSVYFYKKGLETRYVMACVSLLGVGIGSWLFHMTLLYKMQLLDELPMLYGTCVFLYALRQHTKPKDQENTTYIVFLTILSIVITAVYLYWPNPLFHEGCYAAMVFALLIEAMIAVKNYPVIKPIVLISLCLYIFAFFVWNIDNIYCSDLRRIRLESGRFSLMHMVTQLHGWWHIFAGFSTYLHILFSAQARCLHLKRECSIQYLNGFWPYLKIGDRRKDT